ncbi:hypothetical protein ACOMHN_060442 [Nucella lapillus]
MDPRIVALIWVLSCAAVWGQPAIAAGAGQGGDKGSNEFTLIFNDGKADRLILATRLLEERIRQLLETRNVSFTILPGRHPA